MYLSLRATTILQISICVTCFDKNLQAFKNTPRVSITLSGKRSREATHGQQEEGGVGHEASTQVLGDDAGEEVTRQLEDGEDEVRQERVGQYCHAQ